MDSTSPYFTPPTQKKTNTEAAEAEKKNRLYFPSLLESSFIDDDNDYDVVPATPEVPVSSPFRAKPPSCAVKDDSSPVNSIEIVKGHNVIKYRAPPAKTQVKSSVGQMMAPRGTSFRAPVLIGSDSDEDLPTVMRGNIKPASFTYGPVKRPEARCEATRENAKSAALSRGKQESLEGFDEVLEISTKKAWESAVKKSISAAEKVESDKKARLSNFLTVVARKAPQRPSASAVTQRSRDSSDSPSPQRFFSKGSRRAPVFPPSSPEIPTNQAQRVESNSAISFKRQRFILSDDDEDDNFIPVKKAIKKKVVASPASSTAVDLTKEDDELVSIEKRMLDFVNRCDAVALMATVAIREDSAQALLKHQPFASLEQVRKVTVSGKAKSKKAKCSKIPIGEDVIEALEGYIKTLERIDHIVKEVDRQGKTIKITSSKWNTDFIGLPKATSNSGALTPSPQSSGKLKNMPMTTEPALMQGRCKMKSYQLYGLNWMCLLWDHSFGGILADDMGLGKTCQVIAFICAIVERYKTGAGKQPWPNFIVVPPSTFQNWQTEFAKFAPGLQVTTYCGSQAQRDEIADAMHETRSKHHVVLTTYTQMSRPEDINNMRRIRPAAAIFDEGHTLKNPLTKKYKALSRIPAAWKLLMTGTPVQNNIMEMIGLLQFIQPDLFGDHAEDLEALFSQKVSMADVSKGVGLSTERVSRARTILEPFILRRRKEQVLKELPAKTSRVIYCEATKLQHAVYKPFEERFLKSKLSAMENVDVKQDSEGGSRRNKTSPKAEAANRENDDNNVWMQLRKAAIHPLLFRRHFDGKMCAEMAKMLLRRVPTSELKQQHPDLMTEELKAYSDFELHLWCKDYPFLSKYDLNYNAWLDSGKVKELLKLVHDFKKKGDRMLVFTRFAKVIEILAECLALEGIKTLSIQGSTDVSNRQSIIDEFYADKDITVMLLTTGAGGTGINLTAANKVIIFDMSDNPQDDLQAENRAHRLGQTKDVEVIRLVTKNTIEELVHRACQKKLELASKVTGCDDGEMEAAFKMTIKQMEEAVREELCARDAMATPASDEDTRGLC